MSISNRFALGLFLALALSLGAHADGIVTAGVPAGQLPGTTTNDNAAAGNLGELLISSCVGPTSTATVTITIATPGVITWTAHPFSNTLPRQDACPVVFTTSGALPTGLTAGTVVWVIPSSITVNTFQVASSVANALAGTAIATSGTQSGVQTATAGAAAVTATPINVTGLNLTAGDWDCGAQLVRGLGATTSVTLLKTSINTVSATDGSLPLGTMDQFAIAANVMGADHSKDAGPVRESLSVTTPTYLVQDDTFTVSTNKGYGELRCRRVR